MSSSRQVLAWMLRVVGAVDLLAFLAVVAPASMLDTVNRGLGLEPLSESPLTLYLARSTSLMYGSYGVLLIVLASDVVRYRPVIRCIALCGLVVGTGLLWIDITTRMPPWWTLSEGPCCLALSLLVLALQRRDRSPS